MGDFTKINVKARDSGGAPLTRRAQWLIVGAGELDPHGPLSKLLRDPQLIVSGATGLGNPIGGLVFSNAFGPLQQIHEWTSFAAYNQYCFRACTGPNAALWCEHVYDEQ